MQLALRLIGRVLRNIGSRPQMVTVSMDGLCLFDGVATTAKAYLVALRVTSSSTSEPVKMRGEERARREGWGVVHPPCVSFLGGKREHIAILTMVTINCCDRGWSCLVIIAVQFLL